MIENLWRDKIVKNLSLLLGVALVMASSFLLGQSYARKNTVSQGQIVEVDGDNSTSATSAVNPVAPASQPVQSIVSSAQNTQSPANSMVNINTATMTDLDSLPGIGPAYAQRIIDYRTANGAFASIEELVNIKGIGPKTLDKIRSQITI